jgi:hypothetical protein
VYALTSRTHEADAIRAIELLREAMRRGYGYEFLATDPDLAAIRSTPDFRKLQQAVDGLQPSQK